MSKTVTLDYDEYQRLVDANAALELIKADVLTEGYPYQVVLVRGWPNGLIDFRISGDGSAVLMNQLPDVAKQVLDENKKIVDEHEQRVARILQAQAFEESSGPTIQRIINEKNLLRTQKESLENQLKNIPDFIKRIFNGRSSIQ